MEGYTPFTELDATLVAELYALMETVEPVHTEYTTFQAPYDHTVPQYPLVEVYELPNYRVKKVYTWYNPNNSEIRCYANEL